MKAVVERTDMGEAVRMRWVQTPEIFTGEDEAEHGPIAYGLRGSAHAFESFATAGEWVDANAAHGPFAVHPVRANVRPT